MNSMKQVDSSQQILVTGSNGFIGVKVVELLLQNGFAKLRCFVRPSSNLTRLNEVIDRYSARSTVELLCGDLLSREDCEKAARGVTCIYHLAAGFEKSFAGAFMNSALATRNLIEAFLQHGTPIRFVNVSSFAVYSNLRLGRRDVLDESCPLEDSPQERSDPYGFGKLQQEAIVRRYAQSHQLPYVILRPGAVFGPGKSALSGRVGINTFGPFIHLGGSNRPPHTFVDNCAEAIYLAGIVAGIDGEVFNVVDDDLPTSRSFLRRYKKATRQSFSIPVPYPITLLFCLLWEKYCSWSKGQLPPVFNRRRCSAEWKGNRYSNAKLKSRLGWKPRVPMDEAIQAFLAQFKQSGKPAA